MLHHLPHPLIVAHRGYSSNYPENTLAAFEAAVGAGAHMIELDVCLSKDRQLVVIHDKTVDRTTNGTGAVHRLPWKQISRLDAGSWFAPRFHQQTIPSLEQVLALAQGRLLVNVEIKPEAFETHAPADAVERQVLALLRRMKMADAALISSFEWQLLERMRRLDPGIALGLLSDVPADGNLHHWCRRLGAFSWHPDFRVLSREQVAELHQMGIKVLPYAVDGTIDVGAMLAMAVDGLILDDPTQMVSH